jgi:FkbM family methyltransferase
VKIGDYEVSIQSNNSLWREYQKNPEYTAQLGRIAASVFESYPDAYAIDIGANIGDTAALIKSQAKVPIICVEGDSAVFPILEKNISPMKDVSAFCCFLGERTEDVHVTVEKDGWDATLIPTNIDSSKSARTMPLLSLPDLLLRAKPRGACKLLKVDIEGFDLRVIRGATTLLRSDHPVILFEFNHQNLTKLDENGLAIFAYLADQGYERLHIYDAQGFFITQCPTSDSETLCDLDNYARCVQGLFYYDICAFHSSDSALADRLLESERSHRRGLIRARLEAESF